MCYLQLQQTKEMVYMVCIVSTEVSMAIRNDDRLEVSHSKTHEVGLAMQD